MKLLLLSDDGTVIDSTDDFTRDEWDQHTSNTLGAMLLLSSLNADAS